MGRYINIDDDGNILPAVGKVDSILKGIKGSKIIDSPPPQFSDDIVCVVTNFRFDAAVYCFDEEEFNDTKEYQKTDTRPYTWMIVPGAKNLSK